MAWFFFAEAPPLAVWLGAPLVLAGLALQILRGGVVAPITRRQAPSS